MGAHAATVARPYIDISLFKSRSAAELTVEHLVVHPDGIVPIAPRIEPIVLSGIFYRIPFEHHFFVQTEQIPTLNQMNRVANQSDRIEFGSEYRRQTARRNRIRTQSQGAAPYNHLEGIGITPCGIEHAPSRGVDKALGGIFKLIAAVPGEPYRIQITLGIRQDTVNHRIAFARRCINTRVSRFAFIV